MQIRVGYDLTCNFPQETPMILALNIHYSRASDLIIPDHLTTDPLSRLVATVTSSAIGVLDWWRPAGRMRIHTDALIR